MDVADSRKTACLMGLTNSASSMVGIWGYVRKFRTDFRWFYSLCVAANYVTCVQFQFCHLMYNAVCENQESPV